MATIACISKLHDFLSALPHVEIKCLEHSIVMLFLQNVFYSLENFRLISHLLQNAYKVGRHGGPEGPNVLAKDIPFDGGRHKTRRGKWNRRRKINYELCLLGISKLLKMHITISAEMLGH